MNRSQRQLIFLLVVIVVALFLVRREYAEFVRKSSGGPAAEVPATAQQRSPITADALHAAPRGVAREIPATLSAEDQAILVHARQTAASALDDKLPVTPIADWMDHAAGSSAIVKWEINGCGPENAEGGGAVPVCALSTVEFPDNTQFQSLILLGHKPSQPGVSVQYSDPSLMWASYQERNGVLTPTALSSLEKIARQAGRGNAKPTAN